MTYEGKDIELDVLVAVGWITLYCILRRDNPDISRNNYNLSTRFLSGDVYPTSANLWDIISKYLFQVVIFFDLKHAKIFKQRSSEFFQPFQQSIKWKKFFTRFAACSETLDVTLAMLILIHCLSCALHDQTEIDILGLTFTLKKIKADTDVKELHFLFTVH